MKTLANLIMGVVGGDDWMLSCCYIELNALITKAEKDPSFKEIDITELKDQEDGRYIVNLFKDGSTVRGIVLKGGKDIMAILSNDGTYNVLTNTTPDRTIELFKKYSKPRGNHREILKTTIVFLRGFSFIPFKEYADEPKHLPVIRNEILSSPHSFMQDVLGRKLSDQESRMIDVLFRVSK